ncbi:MAG: hypothetical protein IPM29_29835 [Planctomycetes bacterium]|nr:hypothetical protein [Planctomycetota bacterium]
MSDRSDPFEAALARYAAPVDPARRARARELAIRALAQRVRQRRLARAALAVLLLAMGWLGAVRGSGAAPVPTPIAHATPAAPVATGWRIVRDSPDVVARLAVGAAVPRGVRFVGAERPEAVGRIGDDELGDWLRAAGCAPARMRVGGRVVALALVGP